ncbi:SOS response-associated peptidase, partial [Acinetobacter baumannii]
MCSNYEPIAKDRIHLLDLFEPTFEYKSHIYPNYEAPLLFSKKEQMEWRLARFGLVA